MGRNKFHAKRVMNQQTLAQTTIIARSERVGFRSL